MESPLSSPNYQKNGLFDADLRSQTEGRTDEAEQGESFTDFTSALCSRFYRLTQKPLLWSCKFWGGDRKSYLTLPVHCAAENNCNYAAVVDARKKRGGWQTERAFKAKH